DARGDPGGARTAGARPAARAHFGHRVRSPGRAPAPAVARDEVSLGRAAARGEGPARGRLGGVREPAHGGRRAAVATNVSQDEVGRPCSRTAPSATWVRSRTTSMS